MPTKISCPSKASLVILVTVQIIVWVRNSNLVTVSLKKKQALLASNLSEIGLTDWNGQQGSMLSGALFFISHSKSLCLRKRRTRSVQIP
jgi:hypothetical protein